MKKSNESKDPVAWAAAHDITKVTRVGEDIAKDAMLKATADMAVMLAKLNTTNGKIEMLKHHALYIGIATQFRNQVLPLAEQMVADLTKATHGDKQHASMMTDIWLAKLVRDVVKAVNDYEQE